MARSTAADGHRALGVGVDVACVREWNARIQSAGEALPSLDSCGYGVTDQEAADSPEGWMTPHLRVHVAQGKIAGLAEVSGEVSQAVTEGVPVRPTY
jgi:hypothetical protein